MSILTTPLLSFSARGQLAKTLVFSGWKGLHTVRQYVIPANPRTPGQIAQRNAMNLVVNAWRYYFTNTVQRTAWTRDADSQPRPMAGYHAWVSNTINRAIADPTANYCYKVEEEPSPGVNMYMLALDDGSIDIEPGNFVCHFGYKPNLLDDQIVDVVKAGGIFNWMHASPIGTTFYFQLRKDGVNRSGICKLTTTFPP